MTLLHPSHLYFIIIFYAVPAPLSHMYKSVATIVPNPLFWPFATYNFLYTLIISNAVPARCRTCLKNVVTIVLIPLIWPPTYNFLYSYNYPCFLCKEFQLVFVWNFFSQLQQCFKKSIHSSFDGNAFTPFWPLILYYYFLCSACTLSHMYKNVATIVPNPLFWPFATYNFLYTLIISNAVPARCCTCLKNVVTIVLIPLIWPPIISFINLLFVIQFLLSM